MKHFNQRNEPVIYTILSMIFTKKKFSIFLFFCLVISRTIYGDNPKVYDCFMLFNEIDLLKIRMDELDDVVDYFVIVESTKTFSGIFKPLYWMDHKHEFNKYKDKIIHIVVDRPSDPDFWQNEFYQRNQYIQGITNAKSSDIVICSDADEIPRASTVREIVEKFRTHSVSSNTVFMLELDYYAFKFNNRIDVLWRCSCITTADVVRRHTPCGLRTSPKNVINFANAGWHFSWMTNPEDSLIKLKAFSHAKDPFVKDDKTMLNYFSNRIDFIFAGYNLSTHLVPIDSSFPNYLRNNLDFFIEQKLIIPIGS